MRIKTHIQIFLFSFIPLIVYTNLCYGGNPVKITLAYQLNESYPYQMGYGGKIANPPGIAVDILKAVSEKLKIKVEFLRYPNKRVQLLLRKGDIDGAFMYSFKENRMQNGRYPRKNGMLDSERRIATLRYSLYKLRGSLLRWDGKKVSGLNDSIGAGRGYSIVGDLQNIGVQVLEVNSVREAFRMLIVNRLDGVAAQETTADPLIKKNGYNTIEKLEVPLTSKEYYLMWSHQFMARAPDIAEQFWDIIGQVREQVLQDVASKYLK